LPTEYRFDDLDLREEPAHSFEKGDIDLISDRLTKCITTTTLPTNNTCNTCTC
jgi:hypothetical protein